MLRLAQKAFYPGTIPFPLLHIDTTYKFREMIEFRDRIRARDRRETDRPHQSRSASTTAPIRSARHAEMLRPAEDAKRCSMRLRAKADSTRPFGGARRDEEKSRAKERIYSFRDAHGPVGSRRTSGPNCGTSTTRASTRAKASASFPLSNWTELDIWQYIHVENIPIVPLYFAQRARDAGARRLADPGGADDHALLPGEKAADGDVPHALAGMQPVHRAPSAPRPTPCRRSSRRLISFRRSERENRVIDHDRKARWKSRSARDISNGRPRYEPPAARSNEFAVLLERAEQGTAALHHGRQRGRRQVHADRPPALRFQGVYEDQLAAVQQEPRSTVRRRPSIFRCSPTACAPSASRASPSTWPTAISPRRGASSSSPTRPGHEQYTRNMATGASTADLAIILIDARNGVLPQSRRHAYIASLLGIPSTSSRPSTRWTWWAIEEDRFLTTSKRNSASLRTQLGDHRHVRAFRSARLKATTWSSAASERPGTGAERCSNTSKPCRCTRPVSTQGIAFPGAVRDSAGCEFPWIRWAGCRRSDSPRRPCSRTSIGPTISRGSNRDLRWRTWPKHSRRCR